MTGAYPYGDGDLSKTKQKVYSVNMINIAYRNDWLYMSSHSLWTEMALYLCQCGPNRI